MAKNKHINKSTVVVALLAVAVVGLFGLQMGWFSNVQFQATQVPIQPPSSQPPAQIPPASSQICTSNTQPSLALTTSNKYTGGAIVGVNVGYRIHGTNSWTTSVTPATITSSPGDVLDIYVATNNATNYGTVIQYTMPCASYPKLEVPIYPVATVTSLSATTWNKDGTVNANGTADQTVNTGDIITMPFRVSGQFQKAYGSVNAGAFSNSIVCFANKTVTGGLAITDNMGNSLTANAPVPAKAFVGTNATYSWYFPVIESSKDYNYNLVITADSATKLAAGIGYAQGWSIACQVFDSGPYLDSTYTNSVLYGIQNELRTDNIGATSEPIVKFALK